MLKKEIHVIDEEEMTPAQISKREEIVLSLKKKLPDFIKRYGVDDAERVMYATATKMAMEEELDEAVDKSSPVYKEYLSLKKMSIADLRKILSQKGRGAVDLKSYDKQGAISDLLRGQFGSKKVAAAMGLEEEAYDPAAKVSPEQKKKNIEAAKKRSSSKKSLPWQKNYDDRKRKEPGMNEEINDVEEIEVDEALTMGQRLKAKQNFRKNKSKIMIGRKKAAKKRATTDTLKDRATKEARKAVEKKILQGKSKADLSFSARQALEDKVSKKKATIERLAKKLFKDVKKRDVEKFKKPQTESIQSFKDYLDLSEAAKVNVAMYIDAEGKKPEGKAAWAFSDTDPTSSKFQPKDIFVSPSMSFADAQKWAIKELPWAKTIYLLP